MTLKISLPTFIIFTFQQNTNIHISQVYNYHADSLVSATAHEYNLQTVNTKQCQGVSKMFYYPCGGRQWLAHPPRQDILSSIHCNRINTERELQVKWELRSSVSV